ncbi:hypothetical protein MLD38_005738 [Melastoma candidum]|uniref:Uncharacterized protein n=1 Tax=Melastoma candidum TaxID=119954 RepID=A0ACB9RK79_9MYRT|nr:hypothetical protein MLD38_005738 [Melastoma candidum]
MDSVDSSSFRLPLIDLSLAASSCPGSAPWDTVQDDVRRALEDHGCFRARYDPLTEQLHDVVFGHVHELFSLPKVTKQRFVGSDPGNPYNGYLTDLPSFPLHEAMSMAVGSAGCFDSSVIRKLTDLMFPGESSAGFGDDLSTYVSKLVEVDKMVKKMVFQSFGLEAKYLDRHNESTNYTVRLLRYDAPGREEPIPAGITHYDVNFLTILQQNGVSGLEIETKDGNWIRVPQSSSTFVVMTGESFHGWSNGRLRCPRHRVMMAGDETRYSTGFFSSVKGTVESPDELVDDQHPALYKPFDQDGLVRIFQHDQLFGASALTTFFSA